MDSAVPLEAIPSWGSTFSTETLEGNDGGRGEERGSHTDSPFPVERDFNEKIKLWSGIPWKLAVDAVVNSTSETFESCEVFRGETIHVAAGPNLAKACREIKACRTSQACVTDAFNLPVVKKIIHTVGPRYAAKYHTAAEKALCHCIWSSLEKLVEEKLRTIAIGCIYTRAKGFPRDTGAHITARTIRRYLEKHRSTVDVIVLCIPDPSDLDIYEQVLPLYFPQTEEEEREVLPKVPENVGNERGESLMSHRDIRISEMPTGAPRGPDEAQAVRRDSSTSSMASNQDLPKPKEALSEISGWSSDFTQMTESPDSKRKLDGESQSWTFTDAFNNFWSALGNLSVTSSAQSAPQQAGNGDTGGAPPYHEQMLRKALAHKTDDIHMMRIFSKALDVDGDPVLVITGVHFLVRAVDPKRFLLYFVKETETVCTGDYSIILLDADTGPPNWPGFSFIRQVHAALGDDHRRNLKAFYALHPTFRLKSAAFFMQVAEPSFWGKLRYFETLEDLFSVVPQKNIRIPEHVALFDKPKTDVEEEVPKEASAIQYKAKSREAFL